MLPCVNVACSVNEFKGERDSSKIGKELNKYQHVRSAQKTFVLILLVCRAIDATLSLWHATTDRHELCYGPFLLATRSDCDTVH